MLIRFYIQNYYSFGEAIEFNMLPSPRYKRLSHHKYSHRNTQLLKLSAIYGANGAGKSNLIKSLALLRDIVIDEELPSKYDCFRFKFDDDDDATQILGIEFVQNGTAFYYAIETKSRVVVTEELYRSGLGKSEDQIVFEREVDKEGNTTIAFAEDFLSDPENAILKKIIEKNLSKPNKPILKLLATLDNESLSDTKEVLAWFGDNLLIIMPESKPGVLPHKLDTDISFKKYTEDMICSLDIGICRISAEKKMIENFLGDDQKEQIDYIARNLEKDDSAVLNDTFSSGDVINFVKEDDKIVAKFICLEHTGKNGIIKQFRLGEESDGTLRLLDFIPAFKYVSTDSMVVVVDEIERSIHPLLIKELIKKFSDDENTKGQFVFTTHESNLLDQEILRQDEIWFVEKDANGCSDLYSLSDFKEHSTKDIRKGYLNGRYGSVPFLANLNGLNWHSYDS